MDSFFQNVTPVETTDPIKNIFEFDGVKRDSIIPDFKNPFEKEKENAEAKKNTIERLKKVGEEIEAHYKQLQLEANERYEESKLRRIAKQQEEDWLGNINENGLYAGGVLALPFSSDVKEVYLTSYFGKRGQPTKGASTNHQGIDIIGVDQNGSRNVSISSIMNGVVTFAGKTPGGGNTVEITYTTPSGKEVVVKYMHMSSISANVGETINAGTKIGIQGSTGVSTGTHLHLSMLIDGESVDPLQYLVGDENFKDIDSDGRNEFVSTEKDFSGIQGAYDELFDTTTQKINAGDLEKTENPEAKIESISTEVTEEVSKEVVEETKTEVEQPEKGEDAIHVVDTPKQELDLSKIAVSASNALSGKFVSVNKSIFTQDSIKVVDRGDGTAAVYNGDNVIGFTVSSIQSTADTISTTANKSVDASGYTTGEEPLEDVAIHTIEDQSTVAETVKESTSVVENVTQASTEPNQNFQGINLQYDGAYNVEGAERLTASMGRHDYNGYSETWYPEEVLPGGGLDIPGRHVASDGTIRDIDGYICVAANEATLAKGSYVLTSLGPGKVYDTGCDEGTIDIYVNRGVFRQQ